jgi:hypothetical protein
LRWAASSGHFYSRSVAKGGADAVKTLACALSSG